MTNSTKLLTAAVFAATTSMAHAGGLSPEIMEAPVVVEDDMEVAAAPSINPAYIVVGVLGALLLAAALQEEEESDRISCEFSECLIEAQ